MPSMSRREALKTSTVALGGALALSSGILAGCGRDERVQKREVVGMLTGQEEDLVTSIADTLLPKTAASPGAREAGVGPAINQLITDCYEPPAQTRLVQGLETLRARCETKYHKEFTALTRPQREEMLRAISAESKQAPHDTHWFPLMRELALRSYFSSEVGMTKALRYIQVPGKWVGCVPLKPGEPAWG
jgi:hypothetical protein